MIDSRTSGQFFFFLLQCKYSFNLFLIGLIFFPLQWAVVPFAQSQSGHSWNFPSTFALLCLVQFYHYFYYVYVLRLCQCLGLPKPLFWHWSRRTYLAHLLQCVFWLALLSMDGMSARGRENRERERQTDRQTERERELGKAYTLT